MEFKTSVFNLIIILITITTELKTIRKYFNGFESQRIGAKQNFHEGNLSK